MTKVEKKEAWKKWRETATPEQLKNRRDKQKAYWNNPENRERRREAHKRYLEKNRDRVKERHTELAKRYRAEGRYFKRRLDSYYGEGATDHFNKQLEAQGGTCAICGLPRNGQQRLNLDHDHETNLFRGVLCGNCNRGIGLLREKIENLQKAVDYLVYWREQHARFSYRNLDAKLAARSSDGERLPKDSDLRDG